jgi:hypothetical protein
MIFLAMAALLAAPAQPTTAEDRAQLMAVVDQVYAAINSNDVEAFKRMEVPEGMTFRLRYQPDGTMKLVPKSNLQDLADTGAETRKFTEKYWDPTMLIHKDMAVFWAPYSFDIDGKRSHCGVDVFDFIRVNGQWKLANSMWTVEPDGCPKK